MIGEYLPPPLLQNIAQVWHLKATVATEIIGEKKYTLNFTATTNGSVAVTNSFVQAMVTRMMFNHRPVVIYGVSKVLLPRDLPHIPHPATPDVAAATAVRGYSMFSVLVLFLVLCI
jgi:hypothetical protein